MTKSRLPPVSINEVFLEHQHVCSIVIVDSCFYTSMEISRGDRAWRLTKPEIVTVWPFTEVYWLLVNSGFPSSRLAAWVIFLNSTAGSFLPSGRSLMPHRITMFLDPHSQPTFSSDFSWHHTPFLLHPWPSFSWDTPLPGGHLGSCQLCTLVDNILISFIIHQMGQ